jgi:hypothetical protein
MNSRPEIEDLVRYETASTPETPIEQALGLLHAHQSWLTERRAEVRPGAMRPQAGSNSRY